MPAALMPGRSGKPAISGAGGTLLLRFSRVPRLLLMRFAAVRLGLRLSLVLQP